MSQEGFDLGVPKIAQSKTRREGEQAVKERPLADQPEVKWTSVKAVKKPQCDVCVQAMVLGGPWFAPDPVVYDRTGHGTQVYLCHGHASPLRAAQGLKP